MTDADDAANGVEPPDSPAERRVRGMDTVRRFVAHLADQGDGPATPDLSDEDWEALCLPARGAETEEAAVARVVLQAYRLTRPSDEAVSESPPALPAAPPPTAPSAPADEAPSDPLPTLSAVAAPTTTPARANEAVSDPLPVLRPMAEPTAPSAPANDARSDPQPTLSAVAAPPQSDQSGLAMVPAPSTSFLPEPLEPEVARPPAHRFLRRIRQRASAPTAPPALVDEDLAGPQPTPSAVAAPAARPVPADEAPSDPLPIPLSFAAPPFSDRLGLAAIALAPVPNTSFLPGPLQPKVAREANHRLLKRIRARASVRTIDDQHRERWVTIASWVRNIGAIILLFAAWQLWGTAITQHHSQTALKQQFQAKLPHVAAKPAPGFTLIPATTQLVDPPQGSVIAQLQIPKIALSQFVVSGTGTSDLALGPGHYLGTALPGQAGNVAIAGHRTTHGAPFNRLAELSVGDPIYLTTTTGHRLTYIVSATPVPVSPTNVTVLNNFGDDRLTLTTCNPEFSARQRLIVVAAYLPPGAPRPAPIAKGKGHSYKLGPAVSSGWDMALAPLVLILVGLLMALGLFARRLSRIFGREGRWLILVPIWLALLLALFEALTNFLPASV